MGTCWQPQGFRLAPDGAHIALLTGESSREIWAVDSYLPALNTSRWSGRRHLKACPPVHTSAPGIDADQSMT